MTLLGQHVGRYRSLNYAYKTDWNINSNHQVTFSIFGDPTKTNKSSFLPGALNIDNATAQNVLDYGSRNMSVRYNGSLTPTWTMSASWAWNHNHFSELGFDDFNHLEAQLQLGAVYVDLGEWNKAEAALRRVLEIDPKTANAFFLLGELYLQEKQDTEAEKALREGLALENRSWQGHFTLGHLYWQKGEIVRAARQVAIAIQLNPNHAEAHLLAGNIFLRAGKREDALAEFQDYLRLAPKGPYSDQAKEAVRKIKVALNRTMQPFVTKTMRVDHK